MRARDRGNKSPEGRAPARVRAQDPRVYTLIQAKKKEREEQRLGGGGSAEKTD